MPSKLLLSMVFCMTGALNCVDAQTSFKNFEFSDDEQALLITGSSDAEKLILDLYVRLEGGTIEHLGGLEVFPVNDAFGFAIGMDDQRKWPKGTYQVAAADYQNPNAITHAVATKTVGPQGFPIQSSLVILPFLDTYWIPTLDAPQVPDEWVKPCPSHIICTVIEGPDVEPFSPPLTDDDDGEGTDP